MVNGISFFKSAIFVLFPALLLAGCASRTTLKPVSNNTTIYSYKTPQPGGTGKWYLGREVAQVMGTAGGSWLERDTRQEEENVTLALSKMPLQQNSVVADIGAGTGFYSFRIAPKISAGRLYAVEVQDAFIEALAAKAKSQNFSNITVVKGADTTPNLPAASVDLALMVDVYHELEYPHEMLQALHRALKPDGKLLLIEYRAEDPAIPIKALHKMSMAQVNKELAANGFQLYKKEDVLPIQHFLLYEKVQR